MGKFVIRIDASKAMEALGFSGLQVEELRVDKRAGKCVELTVSTERPEEFSSPEAIYYREFKAVINAVSSTMELNEILDVIVKHLKKTLKVKGCTIMLLDKGRHHLELVAAEGLSKPYISKGPITSKQSAETVEKGKPIIILDVERDKRVQYPEAARREGIVSMMSVPISVRGAVIGLVRLYSATKRRFPKKEVEFVSAVAEQGGLAIENARLFAQVKKDYAGLMEDTWRWFEQRYPALIT
jgi:signal transduction protein with GAF and PtsI domain